MAAGLLLRPLPRRPAPAQAPDPRFLLWTPGPERAPRSGDSRLPSGRPAALLPAQTGLLEEEDEAAGCLGLLAPVPPDTIPELSRGGAGPVTPPDPRRKMQRLSGLASGLRTPLCTSGPPGSRQGLLPSSSPLGQVHSLPSPAWAEALQQPPATPSLLQLLLPPGFRLLPPGRKSSSLSPTLQGLQNVPFCSPACPPAGAAPEAY